MVFQGFPGGTQAEVIGPVGGKVLVQLGSKIGSSEHSGCRNISYKALSCKLTGSERITRL